MGKTSAKEIEFQNALKSAIKLRAFGVQYSEIIEKVKDANGENYWKSIQACQKVVAKALADDLDQAVEAARNEIIARNERRILPLMEKFENGKSILVSKEIGRIDDQIARLKGLYAPTKIAETDAKGNDAPKQSVNLQILSTDDLLKLKEIQDKLKNG
jgi:hypothetical protein